MQRAMTVVLIGLTVLLPALLAACDGTSASSSKPPGWDVPPWDPADPAVAELRDTHWEFASFWSTTEPLMAEPAPSARRYTPTLHFAPDGSLRGRGFCNSLGSPTQYRVGAGRTLTIKPIAMTAMACAEVREADDRFFDGLGATKRYRLEGGRLTLLNEADRPLLTLVPAPSP